MNNGKTFDYLIKKALSEGENKVELNPRLASDVKSRLISEKGRYSINMGKIKNITGTRFGKAAAVCFSMMLVLVLSFTFIQPVRAIGEKGVGKISVMIYDFVKGKDGKSIIIKIPGDEAKKKVNNTYQGMEKAIGKDLLSKIPKSLAGGYTFDNQALGCYDNKSDSMIAVSAKDGMPKELKDKFNETVTTFYNKGKSQIVLDLSYADYPFCLNSRHEVIGGDNIKSLSIGDIAATYVEYPGVRYPIEHRGGNEDRTKKPSITVLHTIKWTQNGAYYTVYDFNGDLSLEELKTAAATVIESVG